MKDASQSAGGYIRLYRSLLSWEWFEDSATLHVFIFLLLTACFRPLRHAGIDLAPGQLITSRRQIAARTGLSERQVRTALDHLKSTHEIAIVSKRSFSIVSITNYARYQALSPPMSAPCSGPPPARERPDKKNFNPVNPEKKKGVPPYGSQDEGRGLGGVGVCI